MIEHAEEQVEKYEHLKRQGAPVPAVFRVAKLHNGQSGVLVSDLTERGKYWVFGENNREIDGDAYKKAAAAMPEATREKIVRDLLRSCEAGAGLHDPQSPVYIMRRSAFLLAINPKNPADAKVYAADLGVDVDTHPQGDRQDAYRQNLRNAAQFYTWMTGHRMPVPPERTDAHADSKRRQDENEILEYRGWARYTGVTK